MTQKEKRAARLEWGKAALEHFVKQRSKETYWNEEEIKKGEYLAYEQIVIKEGGRESVTAQKAAKNYVARCIWMNGKMVRFDKWTGRWQFLYFRRQHRETFGKAWSMKLTETTEGDVKKREEEEEKKGVTGKKRTILKGKDDEEKPMKKTKTTLEVAMAIANNAKKCLSQAKMSGQSVLDSATTDPNWTRWVKEDNEDLVALRAALGLKGDEFQRSFDQDDLSVVKKRWKGEDAKFELKLKTYANVSDEMAAMIVDAAACLKDMHNSKMASLAKKAERGKATKEE